MNIGAILCLLLSLITLLFSILYMKKIGQMINILKISGIFIRKNLLVYIMPIICFSLFMCLAYLWFMDVM
jgi:hypothetical protein